MLIDKNLTTQLGLDLLPFAKQADILQRLEKVLTEKILMRTLNELPAADKVEYLELVEAGKTEEVEQYLFQKLPQFDQLVRQEAQNLVIKLRSEVA